MRKIVVFGEKRVLCKMPRQTLLGNFLFSRIHVVLCIMLKAHTVYYSYMGQKHISPDDYEHIIKRHLQKVTKYSAVCRGLLVFSSSLPLTVRIKTWSEPTSVFATVKIRVSVKVCPVSHKLLLTICCRGIFIICDRLDSVLFLKAPCVVLVYIPLSYTEHRHIYLVEACISITLTENKPSSEKKQTPEPCLSPACAASSRCISVAGWNICFCCSKNCLFVLTITPWCF